MFRGMPRKRTVRSDEDFQMAPMIDMVFLLLVFFMTVSTLAKDARPELELALSSTAAVPDEVPPRDIITLMEEAGAVRFYWHNRIVSEEQLGTCVSKASVGSGSGQILLRAGPDMSWKGLELVLELCRKAGVRDITLATFEL